MNIQGEMCINSGMPNNFNTFFNWSLKFHKYWSSICNLLNFLMFCHPEGSDISENNWGSNLIANIIIIYQKYHIQNFVHHILDMYFQSASGYVIGY